MNKRFKPALQGVNASNLAEYVVALGNASEDLLSTAMMVNLDIHIARDSNEPTCQDREDDNPVWIEKNVE